MLLLLPDWAVGEGDEETSQLGDDTVSVMGCEGR